MISKSIIITEYIGREGADMLYELEADMIRDYFSKRFIKSFKGLMPERDKDRRTPEEKAAAIKDALGSDASFGETYIREIGNGGIYNALWELSSDLNCGFRVYVPRIPLKQETIEICELLDIDPYYLLSGQEVCLIAAEAGELLNSVLKEKGIHGTVIGYTAAGRSKELVNGERVRYLDRPKTDEYERYQAAKRR